MHRALAKLTTAIHNPFQTVQRPFHWQCGSNLWSGRQHPASNLRKTLFSSAPYLAQASSKNSESENVQKATRKSSRAATATTSLRRVAVEAERSRGGFRQAKIPVAVNDQLEQNKEVTAYCAAEQYDIAKVKRILSSKNYSLDPSRTGLFPQVIHFRISSRPERKDGPFEIQEDQRDVFVFPSGTIVAWNVEAEVMQNMISRVLQPAARVSYENIETEDLEYVEDADSEKSSVIGETIHLGLKNHIGVLTSSEMTSEIQPGHQSNSLETEHNQHETNLILTKIAFSSGLARSTKLATLESTLEQYFHSTRSIPSLLSSGSKLPFTRSFILRKTGELFVLRAQLNLYSELTDSLPDLFWDSRHELGLEGYFDQVGRALDVGIRIKVLNEKMNYAQDIAAVLRERLSEQHGLALEWLIIILISIEVGFEILSLWREKLEKEDPDSMQSLLRRYIEAELQVK